jgi:SAM-dependent methyltransferase
VAPGVRPSPNIWNHPAVYEVENHAVDRAGVIWAAIRDHADWVGRDVLDGTAGRLPLPDASVDVAHARWAYFFGPGSEPGLAELDRVLRPGGTAFVIDNDPERSTFGGWFRRGFPEVDHHGVVDFWRRQGWSRERLDIAWTFDSRVDFEAVVRIELPSAIAEEVLVEHPGATGVDYAVNLWWRRY